MHSNIAHFVERPSGQALINAFGSADLSGVIPLLARGVYFLNQATVVWNEEQLKDWHALARRLLLDLGEKAAQDPECRRWSAAPHMSAAVATRIMKLPRPTTPTSKQRHLSSLLGRALAVSAYQRQPLSAAFVDGLSTLHLALDAKGARSADWIAVLHSDLNGPAITELVLKLGPSSACYGFLTACLRVFDTPFAGPEEFDGVHQVPGDTIYIRGGLPGGESSQAGEAPSGVGDEGSPTAPDQITLADPAGPPTVKSRVTSAEVAHFGQKLGFHCHDLLTPKDLRSVTTRLGFDVKGPPGQQRRYAVLAICSLVSGCPDADALLLPLKPNFDMWIDVELGAFCWNYNAYLEAQGGAHKKQIELVDVYLPQDVADLLRAWARITPTALTLGCLLAADQHGPMDLREFRIYLRACGSSAHPAYRARFARSLSVVYLEVSGSDMGTAMSTAHFASIAPASLFYFGPRRNTQYGRTRRVYDYLNLAPPAKLQAGQLRVGCKTVLDEASLGKGWESLVNSINGQLGALRNCPPQARAAIGNRLMTSLCAAFIVQSGHRGTRLDQLTFGALYVHPDCFLILDKDDGGRQPARLIGKTSIVKQILAAAAECHALMPYPGTADVSAEEPVFVVWSAAHCAPGCLPVAMVREELLEHFPQTDINFARSAWITYLDEAGCDRWLIRVLTGHSRDVTRTTGAYFDKPPVLAASELARQMEAIGIVVFGRREIQSNSASPNVLYRVRPRVERNVPAANAVPDARTILDPIEVESLACWRSVERVRQGLADGELEAPPAALALLALVFLDLYPTLDSAIAAIEGGLRRWGELAGSYWSRPHLTHPTFLSVQPVTQRLVELAGEHRMSKTALQQSVAGVLQALEPDFWPRSIESCWASLVTCAKHFKRLEYPPSLLATVLPTTPAPTLSEHSLMRLAKEVSPAQHLPAMPVPQRVHQRGTSDTDLVVLRKLLKKNMGTTDKATGELRARAKECLRHMEQSFRPRTYFGRWVGDWLLSELEHSAANTPGRLDVSSEYTYLLVISTPVPEMVDEDPYGWDAADWDLWLDGLARAHPAKQAAPTSQLGEDASFAVARLMRNLGERGYDVPLNALNRVLCRTVELERHGSASSCLVLKRDIKAATRIASAWLKQSPLDRLLLVTRATIHAEVGTRARETSSLASDCLSEDTLVIERMGFKVHKSKNAIRTIVVPPLFKRRLERFRAWIQQFRPEEAQLLLLRGAGTHEEGARDVWIDTVWSQALKLATGDAAVRPHSVRAAVFQEGVWPGWADIVRKLMDGVASGQDCLDWVESLTQDWNRYAFSALQAGHGDLRAGIGGYASAAMLVTHIFNKQLARRVPPQPRLAQLLGVNRNSFVQARRRAGQSFDGWDWLARQNQNPRTSSGSLPPQLPRHPRNAPSEPAFTDGSVVPPANEPASSAPGLRLVNLTYLTARVIGMDMAPAIERLGIPLSTAKELEQLAIPQELIQKAMGRARSGPQPRAVKATLNLLFDEQGKEVPGEAILRWIGALAGRHRLTLFHNTFRIAAPEETRSTLSDLWRTTVEKIPEYLTLRVKRSPRYLTQGERDVFMSRPQELRLIENSEIGQLPIVEVWPRGSNNQVMAARYSSIFRAGLLAAHVIQGGTR